MVIERIFGDIDLEAIGSDFPTREQRMAVNNSTLREAAAAKVAANILQIAERQKQKPLQTQRGTILSFPTPNHPQSA